MKTLLLWFVVAGLGLTGCATQRLRPPPLTQADIISMVKAGMRDEDILRRIDETRTVFRLGSEDIVFLRKEGVSDRVVNYMLDTYVRYQQYLQHQQDVYDYDWHWNYRFWYGHSWRHW